MNNVGINTSAFANVVTPFSPLGKQAVGLENAEAKQNVFAPIEQADANSAAFNGETETEQTDESRERSDNTQQRVTEREEKQQQEQQRQDQETIRKLAARDREVRAHEQAHASVGGQYAGTPSFSFQRGPDGVNYAVGGEVSISVPSGGDPLQTLKAAEQVARAALAPADPSPQDRRVAAAAASQALESRAEIANQRVEEQRAERQDEAQAQRETDAQKQSSLETQNPQEARDQRLEELRASSLRTSQLNGQLITADSLQRGHNVGSVLDQLA